MEISFCGLKTEKIEDANFKNRFLMNSRGDFVAFFKEDRITVDGLKRKLEQENLFVPERVCLICAGPSKEVFKVSMKDLLVNYTLDILGIVFSKKLMERAGRYNEKLKTMTDYELACRMTDLTDECYVMFDEADENLLEIRDEDLFVYSYLVRRYLRKLHNYNISEEIIKSMYSIADQFGKLEVLKTYLQCFLEDRGVYENVAWDTAPYGIFRGNDTCHGVLRDFADQLAKGLRAAGETVLLLETGKIDYDYLQQYLCKGYIGFQSEAFGIDFFRKLPGAKIQFWLDNPVFYKDQFQNISDDVTLMCQDEEYVKFIKQYYGVKSVIHMPPGGHALEWKQECERPYDIVFIGGFIPEDKNSFSDSEQGYYEYMIANPRYTFHQGLREYLKQEGMSIEQTDMVDRLSELRTVCQQVINHYRKMVIDTILQGGYELHVYGESWKQYHSQWIDRLIIHPEVSVEESLLEWQKAKVGLNIMSWHKAGMTERVANIMLSGAACLSDETAYLKSHFVVSEQIALYQLEHLQMLPKQIEMLLRNEEWKAVAKKGYDVAIAEHTWEKRGEQLIQFVENYHERK